MNVLEVVGLLTVAGMLALTTLFVSWLVFVALESRRYERRMREHTKRAEESFARLRALEDRKFSEQAAPLIERVIEESKQR